MQYQRSGSAQPGVTQGQAQEHHVATVQLAVQLGRNRREPAIDRHFRHAAQFSHTCPGQAVFLHQRSQLLGFFAHGGGSIGVAYGVGKPLSDGAL